MVRRPRQQFNAFHLGSMDNEPSISFWGFLGRPGAPVFGLIRSENAGKHLDTPWILGAGETAVRAPARGGNLHQTQSNPAPRRVFGLIRSEILRPGVGAGWPDQHPNTWKPQVLHTFSRIALSIHPTVGLRKDPS